MELAQSPHVSIAHDPIRTQQRLEVFNRPIVGSKISKLESANLSL